MKTKTIKHKSLTDLSTFDPMLKDPVVSHARKDFQFHGKPTNNLPTQAEIKKQINKDYLGY